MSQNIAPPVCLKNQKKLKCIQFQADELIQAVLLKSQNPQAVLLESRLSRPSGLISPQKSVSLAKEQAHTDWIKRYIRHFDKLNPLGVGASGGGQVLYLVVNDKDLSFAQDQA